HCVYTYAQSCVRGRCTIFSLRTEDPHTGVQERLATSEVDLHTYRVVQVRARFNAAAPPEHRRVIAEWAEQEGLTLAKWM
ncbi:MAG TPA: PcfJ domain-containing protein, partial [Cytophagales bacterium]